MISAELLEFPRRTTPSDNPQRVLENAVVRLLREKPFYGHLLLGFRRRLVKGTCALGVTIVNGTPTLVVNPESLSVLQTKEQQALLEHGIKHILHLHPVRGRGYNRLIWDIASDLAINHSIEHMPPEAPHPEKFKVETGLASEEYVRLLGRDFDVGNLAGEGLGEQDQDHGSETGYGHDELDNFHSDQRPVDDHQFWSEADSTPECLAEQAVRDIVREAHRKAHGEVPQDVSEVVEGWLAPPAIPWQQVLRQFIGTAGRIGRQSTWQRQHRRFQHDTPGTRKRRQLNLLVAIDVSESTDEAPLREAFAREVMQIARGRQSRITVLYANSLIRRIDQFCSSQVVTEAVHGGGFTDLRPVFDYAKDMHPLPAAIIYLTDGYGPAPELMEFPTLWVLTTDGQKPVNWGIELRLGDI